MKTGLITFHAAMNYGSALQAYALQKYLEGRGHDVEIIDFRSLAQRRLYPAPVCLNSVYNAKQTLRRLASGWDTIGFMRRKRMAFSRFMNEQMNLTSCRFGSGRQLRRHDWSSYDMLVSGSDQIWNPSAIDFSLAYFLDFAESTQAQERSCLSGCSRGPCKVAYAPSAGPAPRLRQGLGTEIRRLLSLARDRGYTEVLVGNIGQVSLARDSGLVPRGDLGLNVFNTRALQLLKEAGLQSACLSFELRLEQIRDLQKVLPCEAAVYGRLPLMVTENCLIANAYGCKSHDLRGPCAAPHALIDRRGEEFPVLSVWGCRSEIENAKTLFLADKDDWRRAGLRYARLRFTSETPAACAAVLARYAGAGDFSPDGLTRGLYYRGVD